MVEIIQVVSDSYLLFSIVPCFNCGGGADDGRRDYIIFNMKTRKEKFIPLIGDITFNVTSNSFSYRKLELTKDPCPTRPVYESPGCPDGTQSIYKPTRNVFTEPLL